MDLKAIEVQETPQERMDGKAEAAEENGQKAYSLIIPRLGIRILKKLCPQAN